MAHLDAADGEPHAPTTFDLPVSRGRFRRLMDPLGWTTPEKCLFVAALFLVFMAQYLALLLVLAWRPGIAPYLDGTYVRLFVWVQVGTMAGWAVVLGAAWSARRRGADGGALVPVTVVLSAWMLSYGCYFFGFYPNLFSGLTLVAAAAVGWALFDRRTINVGVVAITLGLSTVW